MMLFKCIDCSSKNIIYLGRIDGFENNTFINISALFGPYQYLCKDCKSFQWSSVKKRTKYKWYKEKEFIKDLLELEKEVNTNDI